MDSSEIREELAGMGIADRVELAKFVAILGLQMGSKGTKKNVMNVLVTEAATFIEDDEIKFHVFVALFSDFFDPEYVGSHEERQMSILTSKGMAIWRDFSPREFLLHIKNVLEVLF